MNCWKTLFLTLISTLAGALAAPALTPSGITENSRILYNPSTDTYTFTWDGRVGWTYFIQQSSDLMEWGYVPIIEPGQGEEIAWGFSVSSPEPFFMRLMMSDVPTADAWQDDFDDDGFGNQLELDLGTDPLDKTDSDFDGIPDDIEAIWDNDVSTAWKQAVVDDTNWAYYDPDNTITTEADLLPNGDYDGDGISNLEEWFDETGAADFFNGQPASLYAHRGDGQTGIPSSVLSETLLVSVRNEDGAEIENAPLRLVVNGGYAGLSKSLSDQDRYASLTLRNTQAGSIAAFKTPPSIGTTTVEVSLPNGDSLTFTLYSVDAAAYARPPVTNFKKKSNGDGTNTYTWNAGAAEGDWFQIERRQSNGTWLVIFSTTYGSAELPFVQGQDTYSLTIPN